MKYQAEQSRERNTELGIPRIEDGNVGVSDTSPTPSGLSIAITFLKYLIGKE